jgi:hypothetical protein
MAIEVMNRIEDASGVDKETLYVVGGVALMLIGAGLVLSNANVRRYLGRMGVGDLLSSALPDLERYFRLDSM